MHTVATICRRLCRPVSSARNCGFTIAFRVPIPPGMSRTSKPQPAMAARRTPAGTATASDLAGLLRHDCNLGFTLQETEHFERSKEVEEFETIEENCPHVNRR